jgi:hypothetical protein
MGGLSDRGRSGRPRTLDHGEIVTATLTQPPSKLGVTHWSSWPVARHLGKGLAAVARAWREYLTLIKRECLTLIKLVRTTAADFGEGFGEVVG